MYCRHSTKAGYVRVRQTTAFMAWPKDAQSSKSWYRSAQYCSDSYITEQDMYQNISQYSRKMPELLAVFHCLAFFNINIVGLWISLPSQKLRNKIWTNTKNSGGRLCIADFLGQTSSSTCCHDPRYSSSFRFATLQEKMRSNMPRKKREREGKSYEINWGAQETKRCIYLQHILTYFSVILKAVWSQGPEHVRGSLAVQVLSAWHKEACVRCCCIPGSGRSTPTGNGPKLFTQKMTQIIDPMGFWRVPYIWDTPCFMTTAQGQEMKIKYDKSMFDCGSCSCMMHNSGSDKVVWFELVWFYKHKPFQQGVRELQP